MNTMTSQNHCSEAEVSRSRSVGVDSGRSLNDFRQ